MFIWVAIVTHRLYKIIRRSTKTIILLLHISNIQHYITRRAGNENI